jgi:LacI family transcriptional regulator
VDGYKNALLKNGMIPDENLIVEIPFEKVEDVEEAFDKILKEGVDAVLTINNSLAHACLKECGKRGIEVPKDLAFASFDDVNWFELTQPNITGVKQPIEEMGKRAVEMLIDKMDNADGEVHQEQLTMELITRGSSLAT